MRKKRIPTCTTHHQLYSYTAYAVYNYVICKCLILCLVIFTILIQPITVNAKNIQAAQQREEQARNEKLEKTRQQVKESNEYYNMDAEPGSLASKAAMVAKYNEKHNK